MSGRQKADHDDSDEEQCEDVNRQSGDHRRQLERLDGVRYGRRHPVGLSAHGWSEVNLEKKTVVGRYAERPLEVYDSHKFIYTWVLSGKVFLFSRKTFI